MTMLAQVPLPSRKQAIAVAGAVLLGVTDTVSAPIAVGLAVLPLAWRLLRGGEQTTVSAAGGAPRVGPPPRPRGSRAGVNV